MFIDGMVSLPFAKTVLTQMQESGSMSDCLAIISRLSHSPRNDVRDCTQANLLNDVAPLHKTIGKILITRVFSVLDQCLADTLTNEPKAGNDVGVLVKSRLAVQTAGCIDETLVSRADFSHAVDWHLTADLTAFDMN